MRLSSSLIEEVTFADDELETSNCILFVLHVGINETKPNFGKAKS